MNILESIVFGLVQGITEFLPISSSGHLIMLHDIFNWQTTDNLAFDVFLHWGTLVALVMFFFKDIIRYLLAFLKSFVHWNIQKDQDQKIAWLILLTMIPAVLVGYFLNDIIDLMFRNLLTVAIALILVGILFLVVEKVNKSDKDWTSLNLLKALLLGVAQAIALIPGVSRSGITISTGLALKLKREAAAKFSFLMSIPVVFAAGLKKIYDLRQIAMSQNEIVIMAFGFLAALISGYLCLKFLLNFLKNHKLNIFAYYRIALGILVLVYIVLK
jgi:undecaprenyl-diphosphatase